MDGRRALSLSHARSGRQIGSRGDTVTSAKTPDPHHLLLMTSSHVHKVSHQVWNQKVTCMHLNRARQELEILISVSQIVFDKVTELLAQNYYNWTSVICFCCLVYQPLEFKWTLRINHMPSGKHMQHPA